MKTMPILDDLERRLEATNKVLVEKGRNARTHAGLLSDALFDLEVELGLRDEDGTLRVSNEPE